MITEIVKGALALTVTLVLSGCATLLHPPPSPHDACLAPCQRAVTYVDAYALDQGTCSCYRASRPPFEGAFVLVPR